MDWPSLMRLGLHEMRLKPADFWRLTPHELQIMSGRDARLLSMGRDGLNALLQAYPDKVDL